MCDVQKPVSYIQGGGNAIVAIVDPWLFLPMHILNLYICMHLYAAICSDMQGCGWLWDVNKQPLTHTHRSKQYQVTGKIKTNKFKIKQKQK